MPLADVPGNVAGVAPAHRVMVVPKLNTGAIFELTVTTNVAVVAHCAAAGVKV